MKKNLFIAVLFGFSVSEAGALSCPEMEPYDSVENAYNNSDLVFLGRIEESDTFVDHAPETMVLGDPNPPSEYAIVSTNAAFLAMLVAAAAGVGVFAWNSRLS